MDNEKNNSTDATENEKSNSTEKQKDNQEGFSKYDFLSTNLARTPSPNDKNEIVTKYLTKHCLFGQEALDYLKFPSRESESHRNTCFTGSPLDPASTPSLASITPLETPSSFDISYGDYQTRATINVQKSQEINHQSRDVFDQSNSPTQSSLTFITMDDIDSTSECNSNNVEVNNNKNKSLPSKSFSSDSKFSNKYFKKSKILSEIIHKCRSV